MRAIVPQILDFAPRGTVGHTAEALYPGRIRAGDFEKHCEPMSSSESEQSADTPDDGRPSERPSGRASTIIVDPGLIAEAKRISERPAEPAPAAEEAESGAADSGDPSGDDSLTIEEAEHFASAFRASWEPPAPAPHANGAPASGRAPAAAPATTFEAPAREPLAPVHISELPGARRGRSLALASAAIAGFIIILLLGWLATRGDAPEHASWDDAPPEAHEPSQPAGSASAPAAPEPVPPSQPSVPSEPVPAPAIAQGQIAPSTPSEPTASAPSAPAATAQPAAEPAHDQPPTEPAHDQPAEEPEPTLVALRITTRPASASLTLDGSPIENPYDAMHPQGESHVVEATAPGYEPRNLKIELTQKRSVALELEKAPPPPKPAVAPARPKRPRSSRAPKPAPASKKGAAFVEESPY